MYNKSTINSVLALNPEYIYAVRVFGMTSEKCDATTTNQVAHDNTIALEIFLDPIELGLDTTKPMKPLSIMINYTIVQKNKNDTERIITGGSLPACGISAASSSDLATNSQIPISALPQVCRWLIKPGVAPRVFEEI